MKHYNTNISEELTRTLNLKGESVDEDVGGLFVNIPFMPRITVIKGNSATNATASTIYTTPTDRDFYLTSATLSVIKDATSTSVLSSITMYVDGAVVLPLKISGITLTPQSESVTISYPFPIRLDRGTIITCTATTNIANIRVDGVITGYLQ